MSSKQTPRKARHTRHPSNRIPAVSDYESDHQTPGLSGGLPDTYAAPPPRTNTELNLSVLQRYLPSVSSILSIAANAVIYTFDPASSQWVKSGVEGTMFVCLQGPAANDIQGRPRACVFVLSRRGLENVVVDLAMVGDVEIQGELLILRVESEEMGDEQVMGIWIHNENKDGQPGSRELNAATVNEAWKLARMAGKTEEIGKEAGPAMQAIGSGRLTVEDLFRSQKGTAAQ